MDRDLALWLDGLAWGATGHLDCLAHHVNNNLPEEEAREFRRHIGQAMSALFDFTQRLYAQHPDIMPKALRPPGSRQEPPHA